MRSPSMRIDDRIRARIPLKVSPRPSHLPILEASFKVSQSYIYLIRAIYHSSTLSMDSPPDPKSSSGGIFAPEQDLPLTVEHKTSKDAESGDHQPETTQASKLKAANGEYVSNGVLIKHS